jgi:hypothetical protein
MAMAFFYVWTIFYAVSWNGLVILCHFSPFFGSDPRPCSSELPGSSALRFSPEESALLLRCLLLPPTGSG